MKLLFFGFTFFLSCICLGQTKYNFNNTSLKETLAIIEEKTEVYFSYSDDFIVGRNVSIKDQELTLDELLHTLSHQTALTFKKISKKQVIISLQKRICGTLVDVITQQPLPFVSVFFDTYIGTTTNENGSFEIQTETVDSQKATFSLLGYKELEIIFKVGDLCKRIELHPKKQTLNEVVVIGYVTSGIDRNKDGSLSLKTEKLGILPGLVSPDIAQSIQLIPGISSLNESATGIQIRGGSPDQNLVLFDNIKLYNTGYFYGMFSLFNPFASKNTQIFRSGTSANYGDRISGIIDISSGTEIPTKTEGGIEIDGLALNTYVKKALSEKVGIYVFARRSYTDFLKTPTYDSYSKKIFSNAGVVRDINGNKLELETDDDFTPDNSQNNFSFTDVSAKLILKPNAKNTISISSLYTHNSLGFDFNAGEEQSIDDITTTNKGLGFKWKDSISEKQEVELSGYFSDYDSFYQNDELEDETGDGNLDVTKISLRKNRIIEAGVHFTSTSKIAQNQQLRLGYQLSNTDLTIGIQNNKPFEIEESESDPQNTSNFKNALFSEYTYNFKNNGLINTGLRLVHYSSIGKFRVEPRVNFEYPVTKRLRIKYALERRNQPISQLVEFNNIELRLENDLWRLSDDNTFPLLTSNQVSGGLLYHYKNINIDIDAYYKELDGLTTFTSGFSNPLENLEKGESTIMGIDILLKYRLKNYRIWSSYTFNDVKFKFSVLENTPSSFPGNNDIKHQFRISNSITIKNWQLSLGWQIRSGKPITPVNSYKIKTDADGENAGVVNFGSINSHRLSTFHRLDTSFLYNFYIGKKEGNLKKVQVGLSMINLYNRIIPLDFIYKAEVKPLDDGGIAKLGTNGESFEDRELILEQVVQRFSLGFTPNLVFRIKL